MDSDLRPARRPLVRDILGLIVALAFCFGAAGLGSIATFQGLDPWYASLRKPSWSPPNWVFGPVWTLLYALMAVSAWLVWRGRSTPWEVRRRGLSWFAIQLGLNALWSWLFFAWRSPGMAFVEVLVLWLAILATALSFRRPSPVAASLLVPYLAWVSFASALNGAIFLMNRSTGT